MASVEIKSDWRPIYRSVTTAFWQSVDDMKRDALGRVRRRSNTLANSAQIERRGVRAARLKFTARHAKAIERGRYSEAKAGQRLAFTVNGKFVRPRATRAAAKPYLFPAGRAWKQRHFPNRLKQTGGR